MASIEKKNLAGNFTAIDGKIINGRFTGTGRKEIRYKNIWESGNYLNNMLDGKGQQWEEYNGEVRWSVGNYSRGKKNGTFDNYNTTGIIKVKSSTNKRTGFIYAKHQLTEYKNDLITESKNIANVLLKVEIFKNDICCIDLATPDEEQNFINNSEEYYDNPIVENYFLRPICKKSGFEVQKRNYLE